MSRFINRGVATIAAVLLAAPCAFAENSAIELAPITIHPGDIEPSPFDDLLDRPANPGTLTAPGIKEKQRELARMPGAVTLVPATKFKDKYAANLEDTFAFTPGIFVKKRYGQEVRLSIRGAGLSRGYHLRGIELLQNGVPLNDADGSGDFQEVDPLTAQHIEVYRGGDGLQFGAASLGGAINIVTPTAYTANAANLFRVDGGSFGTVRAHGEVARVIGDTDLYASITGLSSTGYRDHSEEKSGRFAANIGQRFNDNAETRFYLNYNSVNQELPGTLTLVNALSVPSSASSTALGGNQQRNARSFRFANRTSFAIGDSGLLDIGVFAGYHSLFHPIFQVIDQGSTNFGAFTRYTDEGTLFGHRNVVTFGARYARTELTARQFANIQGNRGTLTQDGTQNSNNTTLYAENSFYVVPKIALVTGLQAVNSTRDYRNNFDPAKNDTADFTTASPKLGALWDITPAAQAYVNVTRSYEPPIMSDLAQTNLAGIQFAPLDPQRALTFEVGTRGSSALAVWDVTFYRADVRDELVNFTVTPSVPAATFNARKTLHQGIEASLSLDAGKFLMPTLLPDGDKLVFEHIYNWSEFKFKGDATYGNNRLAGAAPHVYAAALRYRSAKGWDIAPKFDWIPNGGYVDYANTQRAPGYAFIGLEGGIDLTKGLRVFLDARNLADKRYIASYTTATTYNPAIEYFYPGEGRSLFVGFTATF